MPSETLAFRTREAAKSIGISERHLRQLVANGAIRPAKIGRCCVFARIELERFLASAMLTGTTPNVPSETTSDGETP